MKKVLISVGPIPARLDSVKFITNRFKGGLAIKTANYLIDKGFDVTVLAWKFTDLTGLKTGASVSRVLDVYEYYNYVKDNALNFEAFVMAAAVANLAPSNPYEDKFPSHLYKVGEKFNIEFEIAPRAIDVVKKINPRCCLIGYKLFDAKSDEELIEIAKHTLKDSKANIIFANTPYEAKTRKIALFQDDTVITVNFDGHLDLIARAIKSEYFRTDIDANIFEGMTKSKLNKINMCKGLVKAFESTLSDNYGTIGIKVSDDGDFVTTSRGHKGEPVYVRCIDYANKVITAEAKATLNAPALQIFISNGFDYVTHRHEAKYGENNEHTHRTLMYLFPGTFEETNKVLESIIQGNDCIVEFGHGYLHGHKVKSLDWEYYYRIFGNKYVRYPQEIDEAINNVESKDWLDVGCNLGTKALYVLDPYIHFEDKENLSYNEDHTGRFKLITLKNSINYLSEDELNTLKKWLAPGGLIIANSFMSSPDFRVKDKEAVYKEIDTVHHYIVYKEDEVYYHTFSNTDVQMLKYLGFTVEPYNDGRSLLIKYQA